VSQIAAKAPVGAALEGRADREAIESLTIRMVRNRCIPILALGFIISYLDRVNVGIAALTMNKDLGLTATMFGWGAGLVSIGYAVFEVPSNLALERFGARRWMARIMITWGLIGCATAWVQGPMSFYVSRFMLGAVEAGFFPGVILYLTFWFPRRYRARYVGLFAVAIPLASVLGSPVSGMLLGLDGWLGFKGWQWIYILEASPAVVLGVLTLFLLSDRPAEAGWLSPAQKQWLEAELEQERRAHPDTRHSGALALLLDKRVLVLALIFFLTGIPSYGLSYWTPQIVKGFGLGNTATGFVSALPFFAGCIGLVWWGRVSDRRQERAWNTAIPAFVGFAGLAVGAYAEQPLVQLAAICVAGVGIFGLKGPWLAMVSEAFSDNNAAAGIAWVSTLGSLSGFAAPYMVGVIIDLTHNFRIALVALGASSLLGAVAVLIWASTGGRHTGTAQKA
jgi:MFS transporter, ACS family, tartrate transporter